MYVCERRDRRTYDILRSTYSSTVRKAEKSHVRSQNKQASNNNNNNDNNNNNKQTKTSSRTSTAVVAVVRPRRSFTSYYHILHPLHCSSSAIQHILVEHNSIEDGVYHNSQPPWADFPCSIPPQELQQQYRCPKGRSWKNISPRAFRRRRTYRLVWSPPCLSSNRAWKTTPAGRDIHTYPTLIGTL